MQELPLSNCLVQWIYSQSAPLILSELILYWWFLVEYALLVWFGYPILFLLNWFKQVRNYKPEEVDRVYTLKSFEWSSFSKSLVLILRVPKSSLSNRGLQWNTGYHCTSMLSMQPSAQQPDRKLFKMSCPGGWPRMAWLAMLGHLHFDQIMAGQAAPTARDRSYISRWVESLVTMSTNRWLHATTYMPKVFW